MRFLVLLNPSLAAIDLLVLNVMQLVPVPDRRQLKLVKWCVSPQVYSSQRLRCV